MIAVQHLEAQYVSGRVTMCINILHFLRKPTASLALTPVPPAQSPLETHWGAQHGSLWRKPQVSKFRSDAFWAMGSNRRIEYAISGRRKARSHTMPSTRTSIDWRPGITKKLSDDLGLVLSDTHHSTEYTGSPALAHSPDARISVTPQ